MAVKSYNPVDVQVIINGIIVEGYAKDTFVVVARNNDSWALKVGASGEGVRGKSNDKSGTFTVTLLQSSKSNDALSAMAILDEASGDGVGSCLVKDNSGTTLHQCETGWLKKPADSEHGGEPGDREWVVETEKLLMFDGGN